MGTTESKGASSKPLQQAVSEGNKSKVEAIIKAEGPSVSRQSFSDGSTSLHVAAGRGDLDMVLLLLENGASTDVKDKKGKTAGDYAREFKHQHVVDALTSRSTRSSSISGASVSSSAPTVPGTLPSPIPAPVVTPPLVPKRKESLDDDTASQTAPRKESKSETLADFNSKESNAEEDGDEGKSLISF
jgi:hypothetical protein